MMRVGRVSTWSCVRFSLPKFKADPKVRTATGDYSREAAGLVLGFRFVGQVRVVMAVTSSNK